MFLILWFSSSFPLIFPFRHLIISQVTLLHPDPVIFLAQQSPHVSEAVVSANPKPWGFNNAWLPRRRWSWWWYCWKSTALPAYVSISLTTLTAPFPWLQPLPSADVRPRKSLVRRSVFCHVTRSPDVNPPNVPNSAKPDEWDCCCPAAEAPMVAAFWSSAVADMATLEFGCVLTWRFWKGEVISWGLCWGDGVSWKRVGFRGKWW